MCKPNHWVDFYKNVFTIPIYKLFLYIISNFSIICLVWSGYFHWTFLPHQNKNDVSEKITLNYIFNNYITKIIIVNTCMMDIPYLLDIIFLTCVFYEKSEILLFCNFDCTKLFDSPKIYQMLSSNISLSATVMWRPMVRWDQNKIFKIQILNHFWGFLCIACTLLYIQKERYLFP